MSKDSNELLHTVCILAIDDQEADRISARLECERIFSDVSKQALVFEEAESLEKGIHKMEERAFHIILLDKDLGKDAQGKPIWGIDFISRLKEIQPLSQIIMLTADENFLDISKALKSGASEYLLKSPKTDLAAYRKEMLKKALQRSVDEIDRTLMRRSPGSVYAEFICKSPAMQRFEQKLRAVAESSRPILLLGDSGLGKGAAARYIHGIRTEIPKHQGRPFVNINIGAMSDELAQSELFGQDPYSFSGSGSKMKPGLLDVAKNGDVFLDEVGDASPEMQLKLLKVVEERQYTRVGGRQPITTNARFIFATNKDVGDLVANGLFRYDLYMRISAFELQMPILEERKEELPYLIDAALRRACDDNKSKKLTYSELPEDLIRFLSRGNIPGNIRGIQNALDRLVALCPASAQGLVDLKEWKTVLGINDSARRKKSHRISLDDIRHLETDFINDSFPGYREAQRIFERKLIEEALLINRSISRAAENLKMSKSNLSLKVRQLKIKVPKERAREEGVEFGKSVSQH